MLKILIVSNYNYAAFVEACLSSALNQTSKFDLLLFIDDGSTDDSVRRVESAFCGFDELRVIKKDNGGQLSCFNAALPYISDDDLVFFMDADDVYPPDYVETVLEHYHSGDDFTFCNAMNFRPLKGETPPGSCKIGNVSSAVIPCSSSLTRFTRCWIGSPTSALVVSGRLFRQIFPYPHEQDWIIRADDVLVFAASLLGFRKKFLSGVAIGYRIHGHNRFHGKLISKQDTVEWEIKLEKLFGHYCEKYRISRTASVLTVLDERALIDRKLHRGFHIPGRASIVLAPLRNCLRLLQRLLA